MIRRTFLTTLAALFAAPVMPKFAASEVAKHLPRATLLARTHNHCTTDMLARHLRLTPDMAAQVQAMLLRHGVITTPVAGASMATHPLNTHCIPNEALKHTNWLQKLNDARARLQEVLDRVDTTEPDAPDT